MTVSNSSTAWVKKWEGKKVDSPSAADEETRRHCFLSRCQRQQPGKSNDPKDSRGLNFSWEQLITNMDSIASSRAGTLENRQGELGSIDTQPTHDKQKTPVKPGGAAKASYMLVS